VRVNSSGYHWHNHTFVDWRTGDERQEDKDRPHVFPDLNRARLFAPVCAPLRRQVDPYNDPYDTGPRMLEFDQRAGYGLTHLRIEDPMEPPAWIVQRCGKAKPLVRMDCNYCTDPQLGDGVVAWIKDLETERRILVAVRLRDGRRFRWRVRGEYTAVNVAGSRVFVTAGEYNPPHAVLTARIPR
jgi:hypothetical protein